MTLNEQIATNVGPSGIDIAYERANAIAVGLEMPLATSDSENPGGRTAAADSATKPNSNRIPVAMMRRMGMLLPRS